jgi:hypothetical protein
VVFYCGREHQASHWPQHKDDCKAIKKTRTTLTAEIEALNNDPDKPFDTGVGYLWKIHETRAYMGARHAHAGVLLQVMNRTAVQSALDHFLDMLRLNRSDNMGLRDFIPALYLRLGKDQECYDFLKWWLTYPGDTYAWGDMTQPYLHIHNANVFENSEHFGKAGKNLTHFAMLYLLYLLKLRLFLSIESTELVTQITTGRLPADLLEQVQSHMASSVMKGNAALMRDVEANNDLSKYKDPIERELSGLRNLVHSTNKHYWSGVLEPAQHWNKRPAMYSPGDVSEMQLALSQTYQAWLETAKAMDWLYDNFGYP